MPEWVNKIIRHNPGEKSFKKAFTIYLDLECILKKLQSIQNNPEKSYTEKKLDMNLLVGQCLKDVHLIKEKISLIIIEEKILEQLAKEFKDELNCIGDNMEKYITFSVPIKKEYDNGKTTTYKLKFIDSFRFMPASLLELVENIWNF